MPAAERAFRTNAIILKRQDMGEADRLLTLLTPARGKLNAVAHGARKPTSRKTGHVELFARVDVLLNLSRELGTVVQVDLQEAYLPIREDLVRGAYASYVVELLDRFTESGDDDQHGLFRLLDDTLARLAHDPDPRLSVRYYEVRLLDLVGFRPELNECVLTHDPVQPEDQYFSFAEGGVVCAGAGRNSPNLLPLSLNGLKLLRYMQRTPYDYVSGLNISVGLHEEVERLLLGYITYLLERRLQSVDFIRRVRALGAR